MKAKKYIENKFSDRGTFDQIELPTFLLEEMLNDFAEQKNKELIEGIKEIAHIDDKYCCCTACKVAEKLYLKINKK